MIFLLPLVAIALLMLPFIPIYKGVVSKQKIKKRMIFNICGFFGIFLLAFIIPIGQFVSAETASTIAGEAAQNPAGAAFIAAALSTGLSALGAGIAVASAAPAAIGAFSEDASAFGKSLIFVALGEGVALYGLLISILILNKV